MKVIEQSDFKITIVLENRYDLKEIVRVMRGYGCFNTASANLYDNLRKRLEIKEAEIEKRRLEGKV